MNGSFVLQGLLIVFGAVWCVGFSLPGWFIGSRWPCW